VRKLRHRNEIVKRNHELRAGRRGRTMQGVNLRYIINTYVNITMHPPVQLLHTNKIKKKKKKKKP
jgi:hypothetical protein